MIGSGRGVGLRINRDLRLSARHLIEAVKSKLNNKEEIGLGARRITTFIAN